MAQTVKEYFTTIWLELKLFRYFLSKSGSTAIKQIHQDVIEAIITTFENASIFSQACLVSVVSPILVLTGLDVYVRFMSKKYWQDFLDTQSYIDLRILIMARARNIFILTLNYLYFWLWRGVKAGLWIRQGFTRIQPTVKKTGSGFY